jgi:hypothetical protein
MAINSSEDREREIARNKANGEFGEHLHSKPDIPDLRAPRPRRDGELGGYQIKKIKVLRNAGMEGDAFTASIHRDGKEVLRVSNSGDGGPNRYGIPTPETVGDLTDEQQKALYTDHANEIAALNAMALKATGFAYGEEHDLFVEVIRNNHRIEKHAKKHGYTRESVVEEYISQYEDEGYPIDEREKEILRNPDILFED